MHTTNSPCSSLFCVQGSGGSLNSENCKQELTLPEGAAQKPQGLLGVSACPQAMIIKAACRALVAA